MHTTDHIEPNRNSYIVISMSNIVSNSFFLSLNFAWNAAAARRNIKVKE